jgi:choline dehydrogenase-like flavoprotein
MPHREEWAVAGRDREGEMVVVGAGRSDPVVARRLVQAGVNVLVAAARRGDRGHSFTEANGNGVGGVRVDHGTVGPRRGLRAQ